MKIKDKIYQAMDSFLVESEDIKGKQIIRSVEQLNQDRHLFFEEIEKIIEQAKQEERERIKKEVEKTSFEYINAYGFKNKILEILSK